MKTTDASYLGKGIVADINVTELFVKETLAKDVVTINKKSAKSAPKFGEVDLWNIRRQSRNRRNVLSRVY